MHLNQHNCLKKKERRQILYETGKKNFTQQSYNCGGGNQFYMIPVISLPVYFWYLKKWIIYFCIMGKNNKPVLFYDYIGENVVQYVYQYNFNFPCHLRCNILWIQRIFISKFSCGYNNIILFIVNQWWIINL